MGLFVDRDGQPLSVEIRHVTSVDTTRLLAQATADYRHQVGVDAHPLVIPPQLNRDGQYRATFPAFELVNQAAGADAVQGLLRSLQPQAIANSIVNAHVGKALGNLMVADTQRWDLR
ncbi:MAG TPA: hypothetical protein VFC51_01250 [Chloroflexota bacterium]|nr:hypothetical protein [Chloroflexota bacterium]